MLRLGYAAMQVEDWEAAAKAYRKYCVYESDVSYHKYRVYHLDLSACCLGT